jgi:hypothetical protein
MDTNTTSCTSRLDDAEDQQSQLPFASVSGRISAHICATFAKLCLSRKRFNFSTHGTNPRSDRTTRRTTAKAECTPGYQHIFLTLQALDQQCVLRVKCMYAVRNAPVQPIINSSPSGFFMLSANISFALFETRGSNHYSACLTFM